MAQRSSRLAAPLDRSRLAIRGERGTLDATKFVAEIAPLAAGGVEIRDSMHSRSRARVARASVAFALAAGLAAFASFAHAARVGVLSNRFAIETATDFSAKITGHSFTPVAATSWSSHA